MQNSVGKGTIMLVASGIICKLLGAFFRLPLTSIIGVEGIGVFQMVMSVYSFALILTSGGVTTALSKFVSSARAMGDYGKIKKLVKTSLLYCIIFGIAGGLTLFLFSKQIAFLQNAAKGEISYKLMIFLIPFGGVIAAMRGVFQGYENMLPTAISQILEQTFKFALGLLFAFIFGKKGIAAGVFGAFLGVSVSEVVAIVFLSIYMRFKTKIYAQSDKNVSASFLKAVVPLSLGSCVLPLVNMVDSFVVVRMLMKSGLTNEFATSLFGLQTGIVSSLLNFPLIFSSALSMAILPSMSYMEASLSDEKTEQISSALKILWLSILPLVFGICAICKPLYQIVYPSLSLQQNSVAVKLTYFGGVSTIITALMQFFVTILQSKGKFVYCMLSHIIGGGAKILCVVFLCKIPEINIFGVVFGNIALSSVICIMALVKNKRKISIDLFSALLPLLSATAMMLVVMLLFSKTAFSPIVEVILGMLAGAGVYVLFTLPLTSEIVKKYLSRKQIAKEKQNAE